jgi:hypothetical protein
MHNFPENFVDDLEALLKKTRAKLKKVLALELEDHRIRRSLIPEFEGLAQKSLYEFSALTTTNIHTGLEVNVGDNGFELKPALITMVQANQFCEKAHEDASAYLQHFLRSAAPSLSREYLEMLFYSAFSHFHY